MSVATEQRPGVVQVGASVWHYHGTEPCVLLTITLSAKKNLLSLRALRESDFVKNGPLAGWCVVDTRGR
jgi:hypothetical protein